MFLRLFRLGVLAFKVGKRHVQRFVAESDTNRVYGFAFWVADNSPGAESVTTQRS